MKRLRTVLTVVSATLAMAAVSSIAISETANAAQQSPITMLIHTSPWYNSIAKIVALYQEQTGNEITLDTTPGNGLLQKARNSVRSAESPYDILTLDTAMVVEFYEGGFLAPLTDIDSTFALPEEAFRYGNSMYWNAERHWRTPDGGKLMGISPNGNVHLLLYRQDLFDQASVSAPTTWQELIAACGKVPAAYGFVFQGAKGNAIRYDWMPFMLGEGATIVRAPENGDFTVTVNSPEGQKALDLMIDVAKACSPPNIGAMSQGDAIQLLAAGRASQAMLVVSAWSNFDDPNTSAVVGKIGAVPVPRPADGVSGDAIGNWHFTIPASAPADRKTAAVAFFSWFLTKETQQAFLEHGGIPVRRDVLTPDIAADPKYRWLKPYIDTQDFAKQVLGYREGSQVAELLGTYINKALIGELSSAVALNSAAAEIEAIFKQSGRKTGSLPPLSVN